MYIYPKLVIVCEGESDRIVIAHLAQRVLSEAGIDRIVEILPAHGVAIIPRMVRAIEARISPPSLAIIVDSDGRPARTWSVLRTKLSWDRYSLIIAHPNVESWVRDIHQPKLTGAGLVEAVERVPLRLIEQSHSEFTDFKKLVLSHPGTVVHPSWVRSI